VHPAGVLLVGLVSAYCIREGVVEGRRGSGSTARDRGVGVGGQVGDRAARCRVRQPVRGFASTVEAAALTVLYTLFIKCVVYRDVGVRGELPAVLTESTILVGGVLIILCAALGFTNYLMTRRFRRRARPG